MLSPAALGALGTILVEARARGLVGPGPVEPHLDHACGFAGVLGTVPDRVLDLGSGAGIPGLVLALCWSTAEITLLDSGQRRADFLAWAVDELGLAPRVQVLRSRAEDAGHQPTWRGGFDAVVARSFAPPAMTAECAAPFLVLGGTLVVSEPPRPSSGPASSGSASSGSASSGIQGDPERWPGAGLALLGLRARGWRSDGTSGYQLLEQYEPCSARFARRSGVPRRRPLF